MRCYNRTEFEAEPEPRDPDPSPNPNPNPNQAWRVARRMGGVDTRARLSLCASVYVVNQAV